MKGPKRKRIITAGILFLLAVLSITGLAERFQRGVILPPAETYVEQSQEKALAAFITISAVKGIVAVIEGSDVVGIEVGDVVQPLYDAIDITWKLITASLASLYVIEILLDLCGSLSSVFLTITFTALLVFQFIRKTPIRRAAWFTGILSFTFFIAIPMTLLISGKFSESYSKPVREEFDTRMEQFQLDYETRINEVWQGELVALEGGNIGWDEIEFPSVEFPKLEIVIGIMEGMGQVAEQLPDLLIRTGVTWLLDVIIVPLGLLILLYRLALLFTESVFGAARADRLERIIRKHIDTQPVKEE